MFDIYKNRFYFMAVSAAIILIGLVMLIIFRGFNLDVDFAGGTSMIYDIKTPVIKDEIVQLFKEATGVDGSVQLSLEKSSQFGIKSVELTTEQAEKFLTMIKEKYGVDDSARLSTEVVSPTIGKELGISSLWATIITLALMLVYISIRFNTLSGIAALAALAHDALIMLAVYAIFRMPVNTPFIAAILTVLGYSINDTIIVFDRIRENLKLARRESFEDISNKSIMQTLNRSINTSATTLLSIIVLYIIGVPSIKDFSFALIIGIVAGTYSSVFIASPIWVMIKTALVNSKKKQFSKGKA